jgi:hypothetical protein
MAGAGSGSSFSSVSWVDRLDGTAGGQRQGGNTHNGDQVGVHIENQTFTGNQNADDVNRGIEQYTLAHGGQTFNRSPSVPWPLTC